MTGIIIDENGDILIQNGTLTIGECSADVAERILLAYPGEFKEYPTLGAFVRGNIGGMSDPFWKGNVRKQLQEAGISSKTININDNGQINIEL